MGEALYDLVIVGGGAAGLATAIFGARKNPTAKIIVLDGAKKLGSKILISGGGRCNITNVTVKPSDFFGSNPNLIKKVLYAFPEKKTVEFFRELGVELHEEEWGKLFPDSNKAKTVLDALLEECRRLSITILEGHRVSDIIHDKAQFRVKTELREFLAKNVVLATGGLSVPKTGSDGTGYVLAEKLGHSLIPRIPALVPLLLQGKFQFALSGISQNVELFVHIEGEKPRSFTGPMLWTHFGVSGPVVLDASRFWHQAQLESKNCQVWFNFFPGTSALELEKRIVQHMQSNPRQRLTGALYEWIPSRVAQAMLAEFKIPLETALSQLNKEWRSSLIAKLTHFDLQVSGSRGFDYAEVTGGGVPLEEINLATMESKKCPGLYLVGEILNVDGRIGGFNFQWAWSSAWVAGQTCAREGSAG